MLNIPNLKEGEKVELVLKRHWIVYVLLGIYFFIGIVITIVLFIYSPSLFVAKILNIIFWLVMVNFLLVEWINQELDMFVITNNRVIGIEQISFLNRTVTECSLGQIQEVNSSTKGFFSIIFNYGTITIQTAGNISTMKMKLCPHSVLQSRKILNLKDNYMNNTNNEK